MAASVDKHQSKRANNWFQQVAETKQVVSNPKKKRTNGGPFASSVFAVSPKVKRFKTHNHPIKKFNTSDQPANLLIQQLSTITSTTYKPKILLQTERSVLWCIPNFETNMVIGDFDKLALVERPPFQVYGNPAISHRDINFFDIDALRNLCSGRLDLIGPNGLLGDNAAKHHHYADVVQKDPTFVTSSHHSVLAVGDKCVEKTGLPMNGALVNYYRDGWDYVGSHADKEMLPGCSVLALAFGATRTFRIRDLQTGQHVLDVPHTNGMLLCMAGDFQQEFKHEIPQEKRILLPRISITLRNH
jgi:hypothetical protein